MFQDNVQKQEQVRKLKEEKEKNSRVVRNQYLTQQGVAVDDSKAADSNQKASAKGGKYGSVKSKIAGSASVDAGSITKTPARTFLKKN